MSTLWTHAYTSPHDLPLCPLSPRINGIIAYRRDQSPQDIIWLGKLARLHLEDGLVGANRWAVFLLSAHRGPSPAVWIFIEGNVMPQRPTKPTGFEQMYPHIARWVTSYGWIEIGADLYSRSLVRAYDEGSTVWESKDDDTT